VVVVMMVGLVVVVVVMMMMMIITLTVSRTVMAPKINSIAATLLLWCISASHFLYSMSDLYFNMLYICLFSIKEQSSVCLWCVNGGHGSANLQLPIRFCPTHIYQFWFFPEMQPPQLIGKFYITEQKNFVFGILILNNALNCDAVTHRSQILQLQVTLSLC